MKYHCALHDDLAVFGSFDGKIYVWDHVADEIKAAIETDDIVYSRPLIVGKRAFVGCADHTLRIIDLVRFCEIKRIETKEKVPSVSGAHPGHRLFWHLGRRAHRCGPGFPGHHASLPVPRAPHEYSRLRRHDDVRL